MEDKKDNNNEKNDIPFWTFNLKYVDVILMVAVWVIAKLFIFPTGGM